MKMDRYLDKEPSKQKWREYQVPEAEFDWRG